jgi:transposase, IS30 family
MRIFWCLPQQKEIPMSYSHLTITERRQIYIMREREQLSLTVIAETMGRAKSTISRELKRNQGKEAELGYLPDTAQYQAEARRKSEGRFRRISSSSIEQIKERLKQYHSPEQVAGRMKQEGIERASHESIYQMIYANHKGMGAYKQYLRQEQKQRRRKGVRKKRGGIPNRIGIENRPAIADQKIEIGHWESDTVIGSNHSGVVVTHVDKASKYLLAGLAKQKTVEQINRVTKELFKEVNLEFRKTMTFDNGREFCGHQQISAELGLDCYFANPYHSWERGLNEHTNGLIRQFFPKSTNFKIVKKEVFQKAVALINHRPRKSLDYRTPHEVFFNLPPVSVALHI